MVSSSSTAPGVSPEPTAIVAPPPPVPTTVSAPSINPADARITITLNQIPLGEALRYIASQAGLKVKIEPYAVSIIPISELSNDLLTKEYRVPPGFICGSVERERLLVESACVDQCEDRCRRPAPGKIPRNRPVVVSWSIAKAPRNFWRARAFPFPPGASANFLPQSSRLIVRNTADKLELVDAIVEQANVSGPKQVEIESKFVEITQNNLKELGLRLVARASSTFAGSQPRLRRRRHVRHRRGRLTQAIFRSPARWRSSGQFPVTGGNRSGNLAISGNAIDALLVRDRRLPAVAPGIFGLGGVFTDPQFQVVIRALNQKKGVDLLSAPRVTTKSGQRAVIEIVREFRYPTQFQPPQIPQTVGSVRTDAGVGSIVPSGAASPVPVTPTTPTAFETRNTGRHARSRTGRRSGWRHDRSEPCAAGGRVRRLHQLRQPDPLTAASFVNTITGGLSSSPQSVLTPNVINQPIFSTRKVTTSVSVWDGQTVVLGGLMREDVQKTEDRTPIHRRHSDCRPSLPDQCRATHQAEPDHLRDRAAGQSRRSAGEPDEEEEESED